MLLSWLRTVVMACWRPVVRRYSRMSKDDQSSSSSPNGSGSLDQADPLLWSRDLESHAVGQFSFAVVQANEAIEDYSQVDTGAGATFVGVYDGHGGPEAARFISDHLFANLMRLAKESGTISEEVLRGAFSATEEGFLTLVRRSCGIKPLIAAVGSCCLVGVIWRGTLIVANLGDSRAVIGCLGSNSRKIAAEQLTRDHNASLEEVRQELMSSHPDDSHIVVLKNGVWRIKGIIQVSRSIGDAYLKRPEFSLDPSFPRFHLSEPIRRPVLNSEPSLSSRVLRATDKFVIFASDGLWEQLTNQQAIEMVYNNPRAGIARRLVTAALEIAARKSNMRYGDLSKLEKGDRRFYHDDITVVVVFIDDELSRNNLSVPGISLKGFVDTAGPSKFDIL